LVKRTKPPVYLSFLLNGHTHSKELFPAYAQRTGQSSREVYEGAKAAASIVTRAISESNKDLLASLMTPTAAAAINNLLDHDPRLRTDNDLIAIDPKDILMSWIDDLSEEGGNGRYKARLVTVSFPGFGMIQERLKDNRLKEMAFQEALKVEIQGSLERPKADDIKERVTNLRKGLFNSGPFFNLHPLVLSNFDLTRSPADDSWLIDKVLMFNAKDVMHPVGHFKWKGRMSSAMFYKKDISVVIRVDYFTDVMWLAALLFILTVPNM